MFITDVDDCDPNPCLNHGKCVDGVDSYECECPKGFARMNCDESKECGGPSFFKLFSFKYYAISRLT